MIWFHEKCLSQTHPVHNLGLDVQKIFIWDQSYFQQQKYSLKKLVFIYEAACDLGVTILKGNTIEVLQASNPTKIWIPYHYDPYIYSIMNTLSKTYDTEYIHDLSLIHI